MVRISEELLPAAESLDVVHHRSYWAVKNRCNKLPYSQKIRSRDLPGSTGINRDADSRVRKRIPGPVFGPERRCRGFNNLRALAQNRGETGSLETAPSATQSPRCSHSGIVQGQAWGFSVDFRRFLRSREERRRNEGRPRRGGRPVCTRSSREPGFVVRSGRSRDTRPRKADLGSGAPGTAQCCRPIRVSRWPHQVRIPLKLRVASR